jgi:hypothetical protein
LLNLFPKEIKHYFSTTFLLPNLTLSIKSYFSRVVESKGKGRRGGMILVGLPLSLSPGEHLV